MRANNAAVIAVSKRRACVRPTELLEGVQKAAGACARINPQPAGCSGLYNPSGLLQVSETGPSNNIMLVGMRVTDHVDCARVMTWAKPASLGMQYCSTRSI